MEFAVRLPGQKDKGEEPVWLPIDAKFPKEDYERLVEASQAGDADGVKKAADSLLREIERCAKDIHDKYINPPRTTDFAVMFLPTEGLYAEILRRPGFHDTLQQKHHVLAAGPTTLSAILSSLRIGFHTLAIEKRASEVWQVLGAVKTEFGRFGGMLEKVRKQINTASKTLDQTAVRTRAMERTLRDVTQLPGQAVEEVLQLPAAENELLPEDNGGADDPAQEDT